MEQYLTGKKIPFARTPKVKNRTTTPLLFVIAPILIISFSLFTLYRNILEQNWINASVAAFNALAALWAVIAYIGIINLIIDLWIGLTSWLYIEYKPKINPSQDHNPELNWRSVL